MSKSFPLVLALLLLIFSARCQTGQQLVWSDEFSGPTLDESKWMTRRKDGMHGKSRIRADCASIHEDGYLVLTTRVLPSGEIESGMIATKGIQEWQYGRFEARIQFEREPGHHGAFWLQSEDYGKIKDDLSASGAEIDVIEYFGRPGSLSHNIHWNAYGSSDKKHVGSGNMPTPGEAGTAATQFHVYSMTWTPTEYIFSVDGVETWRTDKAIAHHPEYVILSVLASEFEAKKIRSMNFPDSMLVDWVRVYR